MEETKKIGAIVMECVDEQLLLKRIVAEVLMPKLEEVVAKSETKVDDAVLAMVKEVIAKMAV